MGCWGYFNRTSRELGMPRNKTGMNEIGMTLDGKVMRGELSVQEAHRRGEQQAHLKQGKPGRAHSGCEPLDPVLRSHMEK